MSVWPWRIATAVCASWHSMHMAHLTWLLLVQSSFCTCLCWPCRIDARSFFSGKEAQALQWKDVSIWQIKVDLIQLSIFEQINLIQQRLVVGRHTYPAQHIAEAVANANIPIAINRKMMPTSRLTVTTSEIMEWKSSDMWKNHQLHSITMMLLSWGFCRHKWWYPITR